MNGTYLKIRIWKPITLNSKIQGKNMTIKEWVKSKSQETGEIVYTHPVLGSVVIDYMKFVFIYCRSYKEFKETFLAYKEKLDKNL